MVVERMMNETFTEARRPPKPRRKILRSRLFKTQMKNLSALHRSMVEELIDHYCFGKPLRGKVKRSVGKYAGLDIWHYHLDLNNKPDPLLKFQLKRGVLNLLAIDTHSQMFGANEDAFLAAISDDLVENQLAVA
jgi:hypothetical protein